MESSLLYNHKDAHVFIAHCKMYCPFLTYKNIKEETASVDRTVNVSRRTFGALDVGSVSDWHIGDGNIHATLGCYTRFMFVIHGT